MKRARANRCSAPYTYCALPPRISGYSPAHTRGAFGVDKRIFDVRAIALFIACEFASHLLNVGGWLVDAEIQMAYVRLKQRIVNAFIVWVSRMPTARPNSAQLGLATKAA